MSVTIASRAARTSFNSASLFFLVVDDAASGTFRNGAALPTAQGCAEVPFDVDLQKAWEQSCLDHLSERFGKPLIAILGQKNNPPNVERL
jgi:hypothetical protein